MKKILILVIATICLVSCNTVKNYAIKLEDDYYVYESKTPIGYDYFVIAVCDGTYEITYKIQVNHTWYTTNSDDMFNKYNIGDILSKDDFKKLTKN